jgi:hypothetical protein
MDAYFLSGYIYSYLFYLDKVGQLSHHLGQGQNRRIEAA